MLESESLNRVGRIATAHEKGVYTALEASSQVLECIDSSNTSLILARLPEELVRQLRSVAGAAPKTAAEWEAAEFIDIRGGHYAPGHKSPPQMAHRDVMEQRKQNLRGRIEVIRQHFAEVDRT